MGSWLNFYFGWFGLMNDSVYLGVAIAYAEASASSKNIMTWSHGKIFLLSRD